MLISHRKNFIFLKTVKTAGTSIESYYEKWCMPPNLWVKTHGRDEYISDSGIIGKRAAKPYNAIWYNHMPAAKIKEYIKEDIWNNYFKFTIVRNPFDKMVSGFYMFSKYNTSKQNTLWSFFKSNPSKQKQILLFRKWLSNFYKLYTKQKKLVENTSIPHFIKPIELSLIDRDKYLINNNIEVDYFIKYEELQKNTEEINQILNINNSIESIPNFKSGLRNSEIPVNEYYDAESISKIKDLFNWEIDYFNYSLI